MTESLHKKNWNHLFPSSPILFDGGMGTELYERGFYINRPFEELNLSHPREVASVHSAYIEAGAHVITTNTFSITSTQLEKFDIAHQQEALLLAGIKNATLAVIEHSKQSQGGARAVKIALSFGPLGVLIEPLGPTSLTRVFSEYQTLARFAQKANTPECHFDCYILETFSNLDELEQAVLGIRSIDQDRPIIASITTRSSETSFIQQSGERLSKLEGVDAIGINCSEGPQDLLFALKVLVPFSKKPILIQPNAGIPRNINGRYFYMTSPDYMAKYSKRFFEAGAFGVGGCCGTGPDHIRAIAMAVSAQVAKGAGTASTAETELHLEWISKEELTPVPWVARKASLVGEALQRKEKVISVEITSPKGTHLDHFLKGIEKLAKAGVKFVNIPDGARASTRVSSLQLASYINSRPELGITAIPHLTTRDRNLIALQSDLLGASINGVHDLLLVTGDPPKLGSNKDTTAVFDIDSIGLTYLANCLNAGKSPRGESLGSGTQFGIGVAANPTAINLELELKRWKYKVESGADFAITQPIFEAETMRKWLRMIQPNHRPHLVGIWPFISLKNAEFMAHEVPGVYVPNWALEEMAKVAGNPEASIQKGVEIAARLIQELWNEVEGFAISAPLGKIDVVLSVLERLPKK